MPARASASHTFAWTAPNQRHPGTRSAILKGDRYLRAGDVEPRVLAHQIRDGYHAVVPSGSLAGSEGMHRCKRACSQSAPHEFLSLHDLVGPVRGLIRRYGGGPGQYLARALEIDGPAETIARPPGPPIADLLKHVESRSDWRAGCSPGRGLAIESARAITTRAPPLSRSASCWAVSVAVESSEPKVRNATSTAGVSRVRHARDRRRALSGPRIRQASVRPRGTLPGFRSSVNLAMCL